MTYFSRSYLSLVSVLSTFLISSFFFFNDTATTEIYTLSLHDALPIYPVPTGVLQLDVLPGLRRLFAEGPQLHGHRHPGFQPGPSGQSAGPRVEPHPLEGRVSDRVLQSVPRSGEPHDRMAGDELRPGAADAVRHPGREPQRSRRPEHAVHGRERGRVPAILRRRGRERDRVRRVDAAPPRLGHGDG